ncbi:helix-turn-helix domain-containing protein [Lacticaseibacillus brantae]|uniref:Transcriptional regulator, xre family protein n=1 Tax=Lacticaseibacillus brantae DSM 23927 TaxID=1423727 RepID=A0A0R2AZ03_9LACO|nr:helix-turn-helix transcriptional regulator [Lacticaseibacillus brantae]KRM72058.1 Transcriptional regulator, xre family protein [Lacticaseibacillus brantae DSM 23927]
MTNAVGSAMRKIRKNRGESIVEVAKATHTSPASFTKWENDQTIPSERSIRKLTDYYNIDPLELLALAYPDKYAPLQAEKEEAANQKLIKVEDLFDADTVLTYNDKALPASSKSLISAFVSGMLVNND